MKKYVVTAFTMAAALIFAAHASPIRLRATTIDPPAQAARGATGGTTRTDTAPTWSDARWATDADATGGVCGLDSGHGTAQKALQSMSKMYA